MTGSQEPAPVVPKMTVGQRIKTAWQILTNQKTMLEKLKSRKLWITVLSSAIVILGEQLGLSEVATWIVGILAGSYNIAQGIADAGRQGEVQAAFAVEEIKRARALRAAQDAHAASGMTPHV